MPLPRSQRSDDVHKVVWFDSDHALRHLFRKLPCGSAAGLQEAAANSVQLRMAEYGGASAKWQPGKRRWEVTPKTLLRSTVF